MKIKKGFVLRKIGDEYIATSVGEASKEFKGIIKLNETGAFIWKELESDTNTANIAEALCRKYEIDFDTAQEDCKSIVNTLKNAGVIND